MDVAMKQKYWYNVYRNGKLENLKDIANIKWHIKFCCGCAIDENGKNSTNSGYSNSNFEPLTIPKY